MCVCMCVCVCVMGSKLLMRERGRGKEPYPPTYRHTLTHTHTHTHTHTDPTGGKKEDMKNAVVATAILFAMITAVARVGGRAAVLSLLGLDLLVGGCGCVCD
jgi:hypothetical protein